MSLKIIATLLIVFCVTALLPTSNAQTCTIDGIRFGKGKSISVPGQCMQLTCEDPATNGHSGLICPSSLPRRGCRLSDIDYSKPYPQCCPREIC